MLLQLSSDNNMFITTELHIIVEHHVHQLRMAILKDTLLYNIAQYKANRPSFSVAKY